MLKHMVPGLQIVDGDLHWLVFLRRIFATLACQRMRGEMACSERKLRRQNLSSTYGKYKGEVSKDSDFWVTLSVFKERILLTKRIIFKIPGLTQFSHEGKISMLFLKCWEVVLDPLSIWGTVELNGKSCRALYLGCLDLCLEQ